MLKLGRFCNRGKKRTFEIKSFSTLDQSLKSRRKVIHGRGSYRMWFEEEERSHTNEGMKEKLSWELQSEFYKLAFDCLRIINHVVTNQCALTATDFFSLERF
jgi:hypothetical protein